MLLAIHQPDHLPYLGFFHKMARADVFVILEGVDYKKNNFQNRNRVWTPNGVAWATVPVLHKGLDSKKIGDIRTVETEPWRKKYRMLLEQNYGRHPGFGAAMSVVDRALEDGGDSLARINTIMIKGFAELLGIRTPIVVDADLETSGSKSELLVSVCRAVGADSYLSGAGGRDYLDESVFAEAGIAVLYQDFHHPVYPQKGPTEFVPYLSVFDLICNRPDDAGEILIGGSAPVCETVTELHS